MRLTRVLLILVAAVVLGSFSAGPAAAAPKPNTTALSSRIGGTVINVTFSITQWLKLWKSGNRPSFIF